MTNITNIFSSTGAFTSVVPGYLVRTDQIGMAEAIADAIREGSVYVTEAGTGTGKTFAYLVPVLLSNKKVIISTGTKTLQDQLFNKDLPTVQEALRLPVTVALLKGRANYICPYRLENALQDGRFFSREDAADARKINRFAKSSLTGDKADCFEVNENSTVWPLVTSTRDNCLGKECPALKKCFVAEARKKAQEADVVVVNHHLFFADVMLKDEGAGELLPDCQAVIFDEAHQLPDVAGAFFGTKLSTAQFLELARDTQLEALLSARDCLDLPKHCRALEKAAKDLRLSVAGADEGGRFSYAQMIEKKEFPPAITVLQDALISFSAVLKTQAGRSEGLEKCWQRVDALRSDLTDWQAASAAGFVRWGEVFSHAFHMNSTPLDVAPIFKKQMEDNPKAWIFTSATLAVQGGFRHYCRDMGLPEKSLETENNSNEKPTDTKVAARFACWKSPFDYPKQAMLYVPNGLPNPNDFSYSEAVVKAAFPLITAAPGGAFFLCTSLRAMRRIAELLQEKIDEKGLETLLLLQGEGSKNDLLRRFREHGHAILVGSQSFWEGVDVRGEALSLVIIDKIPFAPPDDPVLSARVAQMQKEGKNPFMEYQLPRAVIQVKQGAGRLIRDEKDRGVLMICDPRLIEKTYGRRIWQSLPPMKRSRVESEVLAFFGEDTKTADQADLA